VPGRPGGDEVLHLFAAVPKNWDVEFALPARGGLWVEGVHRDGMVVSFTIKARKACEVKFRDPWTGKVVTETFTENEKKHFTK
jgi:hypothetical protein